MRLDNRAELVRQLGLPSAEARGLSDSALALEAWIRWEEASLSKLRGSYTFAIWSQENRKLCIARGPLSASVLFFRLDEASFSFASTPKGVIAASPEALALDLDAAAAFGSGSPWVGDATLFKGVRRLSHGHLLTLRRGDLTIENFWRPERRVGAERSDQAYVDDLIELLDQAVRRRLRRSSGAVAAHISSGRDSGAVATSAATILQESDETLLAFTAAPVAGYAASAFSHRLHDESWLAGATAARYCNINHRIVRAEGDPFARLTEVHRLLPGPVGHLTNFPWSRDILEAASVGGATVLLSGAVGNFTVSAGGAHFLPHVLREQGFATWVQSVRAMTDSPRQLLRALYWTFGSAVPAGVHDRALRLAGRRHDFRASLEMLREPYRARAAHHIAGFEDQRPARDVFAFRAEMLRNQDPANILARALWNIDVRDPTADQDLIEYCFQVPAHLLVGRRASVPLFDRAFGSRLDVRDIALRKRGYQGADWHCLFTKSRVENAFRKARSHPLVDDLLNFERIDDQLGRWPSSWTDDAQVLSYRNDLLGALSLAHFIQVNF